MEAALIRAAFLFLFGGDKTHGQLVVTATAETDSYQIFKMPFCQM